MNMKHTTPTNNLLSACYDNDLLTFKNDSELNNLLEIAANFYNCPYGIINIYYKGNFYTKAQFGLHIANTEQEVIAFTEMIKDQEIFYVLDASKDEKFKSCRYVTQAPRLKFILAAPIRDTNGEVIGSICLGDIVKRYYFNEASTKSLKNIADQIVSLLTLYNDKITLEKQSTEISSRKGIVSKSLIDESDFEDDYVANELHENFAQTLSATKTYLENLHTLSDMSPEMLQKIKENITGVLNDVKKLSHYIAPSTIAHKDYSWLLYDYINQFSVDYDIKIHFLNNVDLIDNPINISGNIFRIIQYNLKNIELRKAKNIYMSIIKDDPVVFEFKDDGNKMNLETHESEKYINNIFTRIEIEKGTINRFITQDYLNCTEIIIPA